MEVATLNLNCRPVGNLSLRPIRGPLRVPAQPFGLILHRVATLNMEVATLNLNCRPAGNSGPLRGPAQPFGLILRKVATLNCGSGSPETWDHE